MKKNQVLIAALCVSALVLSACTFGTSKKRRRRTTSSSSDTTITSGSDTSSPSTGGGSTGGSSGGSSGGGSTGGSSGGGSTGGSSSPTSGTTGSSTGGSSGTTSGGGGEVVAVTSVSINGGNITKTVGDAPVQLTVTVLPANATNKSVTWSSSDPSVASVDATSGLLTIKAAGETSITATAVSNNVNGSITVKVNEPAPQDWSAADKAKFDKYLHGYAVPYKYVEGASVIRDEEYACVTYGGGSDSSDEAFIQEYAALFEGFEMTKNAAYASRGVTLYQGSLTFNADTESEYTLHADMYLWDAANNKYSTAKTGAFGLDIYDGNYYSWNEFKGEYEDVLAFIYDDYVEPASEDDEGHYNPYPYTIQYEGALDYIEVEDDLKTDGSGYYVAYMYGISEEDQLSFIEKFEDDDTHWTPYSDTVNGCYAFYDCEEKIAIGYMYSAQYQKLLLLIHQYEKIYLSWPSTEVEGFIDTINSETSIVFPAFYQNGFSYTFEPHAEQGLAGVYVFGDNVSQAALDAYVEGLDPTVWSYEVLVDEEEDEETGEVTEFEFYHGYSYDYALDFQAFFIPYQNSDGGYAGIIVMPRAPLSHEFPTGLIDALYVEHQIAGVPATPDYGPIVNPLGGFEVEEIRRGIRVRVYGSTADEFDAYLASLDSGWVLDPEQSELHENEEDTWAETYVYMYGETNARLTIANYNEEAGAHFIVVQYDVGKFDWTDEEKAQQESALHGVTLPFFDADLTYVNDEEEGEYFWLVGFEGEDPTEGMYAAYVAFNNDESWVADSEDIIWTKATEDGGTVVAALSYYDGNFYIYWEAPAATEWTEDDYEFFDTYLGGVYPEFFEGGIDYFTFELTGQIWSYNEFSEEEFNEYVALAKWTADVSEEGTTYFKYDEGGYGFAYFEYADGYIYFGFYQEKWYPEQEDAFEDVLHGIVPGFISGGLFYPEEPTHDFEGSGLFETADELVEILDEALEGWSKSESGANTVYTKNSSDGEGYAKVSIIYDDDYEAYYFVIDWVNGSTPIPPTPSGDPVTVSHTMQEIATANTWADTSKHTEFALDSVITVSVSATDNNTGKYYNNGSNWRLYASGNPVVTISAPEGYVITSVTITYVNDSSNKGEMHYNGVLYTSGTAVAVNNQSSVQFEVCDSSDTPEGKHGQARITAISVTYAPAE